MGEVIKNGNNKIINGLTLKKLKEHLFNFEFPNKKNKGKKPIINPIP